MILLYDYDVSSRSYDMIMLCVSSRFYAFMMLCVYEHNDISSRDITVQSRRDPGS